jgi:hypothetical protein
MSARPRQLEYAKIFLSEGKIRVEIRDGLKIVRRSADYFPTQQLADQWIAEQRANERVEEQLAAGGK